MDSALCIERLDGRSDEDLAALVTRGEAQSFAILADRYRTKAIRIAYGILHNRADAEDAVQNAFIRVYRSLDRFRGDSRFSSWLYRIVVNESIRLMRSRRERSDEIQELPAGSVDAEKIILVSKCLAGLPIARAPGRILPRPGRRRRLPSVRPAEACQSVAVGDDVAC